MATLRLIVNGDDYGRDRNINRAVIQAHEQGVLTSASLMVTGDAVRDAVERAHRHPSLAVGLHLAVTGARTALPARQVPHLADAQGRLPRDPLRAGVACFLSPAVRRELRRELVAQFERFCDTGLALSHVDSHHLMHLHPVLFSLVIPLAEQYHARGIRIPRDDLWRTLALDRQRKASKVAWAAIYALLCRLAIGQLVRSPVVYADRVYGLLQSGCMHETFVEGLVQRIPSTVGSAELYLHPSTHACDGPYGPNPGDLAALLSPRVRRAIEKREAQLTTYPALGASNQRRMVCPGH
jgi:hopanoid biosynthesis associated protein HpnK